MAMGHVILKEFFVDATGPLFVDYVRKFTDLPFLIELDEQTHDGQETVPGKFVTADQVDLGLGDDDDAWKPVFTDDGNGAVVVPNGSIGFRYAEAGPGQWNLDRRASRLGCRSMTTRGDAGDDQRRRVRRPGRQWLRAAPRAFPHAGSATAWSPPSTT